jgi:TonB dependent receptor
LFFAIDSPYTESAGVDPGIVSGTPAHLETSIRHWRNWEIGAYLQDDWKISKRLTLNLGIRYDLYTRHTELNNLATTFLKGPGKNFIDNIPTGAGQIKNASTPCPGDPIHLPPLQGSAVRAVSRRQKNWAEEITITSARAWALRGMCLAMARLRCAEDLEFRMRERCITHSRTRAGIRLSTLSMAFPTLGLVT